MTMTVSRVFLYFVVFTVVLSLMVVDSVPVGLQKKEASRAKRQLGPRSEFLTADA